jgi:hypothetical protein
VPDLVVELRAGQLDLLRVHHDHEIAGIGVRCEDRLMFAANHTRHVRREAAERQVGRIDHEPTPFYLIRLCAKGLHA